MRSSVGASLLVLLWIAPVAAQEVSPKAASEPISAEVKGTSADAAQSDHRAVLAQKLNPADYGRAFNSGAQTELIGPGSAVSSLLVGYDAVFMQAEISMGFAVGGNPFQEEERTDTYVWGVRLAFPIHRGTRADYSLLAAGGSTFVNPTSGRTDTIGAIGTGARFRAFLSPNLALFGSLGIAAFFGGRSDAAVFVGARPLGAAGVVYFFR